MSSICSINSSTSPDVASSNVSGNVLVGELPASRVRGTIVDTKKDNKYWERRRRNNEAARRSREKRRMNDMSMDSRIMDLAERNKKLEHELFQMRMDSGLSLNAPSDNHSKKSRPTLITSVVENHKEASAIQTTMLNGMVFPIFTTINHINDTSDLTKSIQVNSFQNSKISIQSDDNRFQTNLLTLANIPLLSNIIASTNYNEDMSTKPTLLLPFPFSSKTGLPDSESKSDSQQDPASCGDIKKEFLDILDLRMRPPERDCFFPEVADVPSVFGIRDVKDSANHINNGYMNTNEEQINNSFLSGSVATNRRKDNCPRNVSCTQTDDSASQKMSRQRNISDEQNINPLRRHRNNPMNRFLSLRSRLQIRDEVIQAVTKENGKLYDAICSLSDEMRQLRSVIMNIAQSASVTTRARDHVSRDTDSRP